MQRTERQTPRQPPWEQGLDSEQLSFGGWLRRQREIREIPLREIADVTKISMRYLEALESDRFDVLPAAVFAKGFLREYSRYVGLDPDEVVNSFLTAQSTPEEEEAAATPPVSSGGSAEWASGLVLSLVVIVLLGLVASLIFFGGKSGDNAAVTPPPIAAPPPPPVTLPAAEPRPEVAEPETARAPAAPLAVTMDFTEDCWVEVAVDGERRLSELHVQGESLRLEAQERILLTLGNPQGVRIEVNGRPFEPAFQPGRVARDIEIDLAKLAELDAS